MTTEVAQQKRSHNAFLFMDGGGMTDQRSSNRTTFCEVDRKRLKTGCTISTKEKKDKIGERVAALQQLVSPFGKTDTASVLLDATEYVRFLHDQLRVLSAPYLRTTKTEGMQERGYYSLRSRGLCLVPVSSTLRVAQSNGADLWTPINAGKHT